MSEQRGQGGPLTGVAVAEFSRSLPASVTGRLLAEAGAQVVKVEPPGGDPLRERHPVGFASWNRSKASVVLDLATAEGRDGLHDLLARADVFVHDLTPAEAVRSGLDEESLAARHPHLIVGVVTGFPRWHPRAEDPPAEILVQAVSGVMDEQLGNREGPIFTRMPYGSWSAAFLLTGGVAARLVQRARSGVVGNMATSLLQGVLVPTSMFWQRSERLPPMLDQAHTLPKVLPGASLSLFECRDGAWIQLAGALGGWIESPPVLEVLALRDEFELSESGVTMVNLPRWQAVFRHHDSATWFELFSAADVPCMLVRDLGECYADEQARVNGYVVEMRDAVHGPMLQAGPPLTTTPPCQARGPAPHAGQSELDGLLRDFGTVEHPRWRREDAVTAAPLDGLRVLDFGTMVAAPFAAQCFADFGADVLKVERLTGDRGRTLTQFAGCNRGKRSIAIDLKNPAAQEPLHQLIVRADLVVHNIRQSAATRLGLDHAGLLAINPRIVLSHVSANGARGPMAALPGYDPTAQAMTGWERANVGPGQQPIWMRNSVLDVCGGLVAFVGGLFALYHRESTGRPGFSATSLLAVGMTIASETALRPDGTPWPVPLIDPDQTGTSPFERIYRTRDGWVAVAAPYEDSRARLLEVLACGVEGVATALSTRQRDAVVAELGAAGVLACPVLEDQMHAFFDDPLYRRHGLSRGLHAGDYGSVDVVGGYWTLGPDAEPKETIPVLGGETMEILREIGGRDEQVAALLAEGVVRDRGGCA